jgi:hypothetical protein
MNRRAKRTTRFSHVAAAAAMWLCATAAESQQPSADALTAELRNGGHLVARLPIEEWPRLAVR